MRIALNPHLVTYFWCSLLSALEVLSGKQKLFVKAMSGFPGARRDILIWLHRMPRWRERVLSVLHPRLQIKHQTFQAKDISTHWLSQGRVKNMWWEKEDKINYCSETLLRAQSLLPAAVASFRYKERTVSWCGISEASDLLLYLPNHASARRAALQLTEAQFPSKLLQIKKSGICNDASQRQYFCCTAPMVSAVIPCDNSCRTVHAA